MYLLVYAYIKYRVFCSNRIYPFALRRVVVNCGVVGGPRAAFEPVPQLVESAANQQTIALLTKHVHLPINKRDTLYSTHRHVPPSSLYQHASGTNRNNQK